MNFAKTKLAVLNRSFEFKFKDENGEETSETINYSIKQACATPKFLEVLSRLQQDGKYTEIAKCLSDSITKWDIDWNGEEFPPNFENLSQVCTIDFVMALIEDLTEVFAGNARKPTK